METEHKFLPHLINAVPESGYGNRLSMYLIALEAWRRGLKVKFFYEDNPENKMLIRYTLADEKNEYYFNSSLGEKLTKYAYDICENKDETKKILSKSNIPVPKGKRFTEENDIEVILEYANQLGYPLVIKPVSENAGIGVFSNLKNEKELLSSLLYLQEELGFKDILVEEHIEGSEHRFLLVDGKVVAVVNRVPANIKGDGINTIERLIDLKNKSKIGNPTISSKGIEKDIEVTNSIKSLNYDYTSIPAEGEIIYLRSKSNVSRGGDPIDVTHKIPEEMKQIAENVPKAIEGLDICGLDMIIDEEYKNAVILEVNTKPMIGLHVFPIAGEPIDVISPIIDYYFPETAGKYKTNLYFDFNSVISPIRDRSVKKVELIPVPTTKNISSEMYSIEGEIDSEYKQKIRLLALEKKINGNLQEVSSNKYKLIVAHEDREIIDDFMDEVHKINEDSLLTYEKEKKNLPIKIGFEVYDISGQEKRIAAQIDKTEKLSRENKKINREVKKLKDVNKELKSEIIADRRQNSILGKRIMDLEKENRKTLGKIERLSIENSEMKNELSKIIESSSWKVIKPLRNIRGFIKK